MHIFHDLPKLSVIELNNCKRLNPFLLPWVYVPPSLDQLTYMPEAESIRTLQINDNTQH